MFKAKSNLELLNFHEQDVGCESCKAPRENIFLHDHFKCNHGGKQTRKILLVLDQGSWRMSQNTASGSDQVTSSIDREGLSEALARRIWEVWCTSLCVSHSALFKKKSLSCIFLDHCQLRGLRKVESEI